MSNFTSPTHHHLTELPRRCCLMPKAIALPWSLGVPLPLAMLLGMLSSSAAYALLGIAVARTACYYYHGPWGLGRQRVMG